VEQNDSKHEQASNGQQLRSYV